MPTTMKINRQSNKKILLSIIALLVILTAVTVFFIASRRNDTANNGTNTTDGLKEDTTEKRTSSPLETQGDTPTTTTPDKTPIKYEGEKPNDIPAYNNEQFRIPEDE